MKELDVLLGGFLDRHFDGLDETHRAAFAELVEQQDPLIADWIWGRTPLPPGPLGSVLDTIRADAGL